MSDTATEATALAPPETSPDPTENTDPWESAQNQTNDIPDTWDDFERMEARRRGEDPDAVAPEGDKPDDKTPDTTVTAEADKTVAGAEALQPPGDAPTPATPTTPELPADVKEQIQAFAELDRAIKEDPASVAAAIIDGLDARQKAALVKEVLGDVAPKTYREFKIDEYDATEKSPMEEALKERWSDLEAIPAVITENRKLDGRINEVHDLIQQIPATLNPQVAYANVIAEINAVKIEAICEALGIDLPDPDFKAIEDALAEKGIKYRDGVRKVVNYGTAVEMHKQKSTTRPKTPGNESRAKGDPIPDYIGSDPVKLARYINGRR